MAQRKLTARPPRPKEFDPKRFLSRPGAGCAVADYAENAPVFSQGEPADDVFYIQEGRIKLSVVSRQGREAVIAILGPDDFFGEGCLAGQVTRMASAAAMTKSSILRLERTVLVRRLRKDPEFSEMFLMHVLSRNMAENPRR